MKRIFKSISLVAISSVLTLSIINFDYSAFATVPGVNEVVSKNSSGVIVSAGGNTRDSFISDDGNIVFFVVVTPHLAPGEGNIYSRNIESGATLPVDVSTSGVVGNNLSSNFIRKVSATGRYIIFESKATNLIDGDLLSDGVSRLYLRDMTNSTTSLIAKSISGDVGDGTYQTALGVSSDGRFVSFATNATNLHPDSTDGGNHLYMYDRLEDSLEILDRKEDGTLGFTVWNFLGDMSCDGSMIVFQYGGNIRSSEYNSKVSTYLIDRRGSADKIINITKSAINSTHNPSISCNGDYIAFSTQSNNLDLSVTVPHDGKYRPYVYDRVNQTFKIVSVTTANTVTNKAVCSAPFPTSSHAARCVDISDDGIATFSAIDSDLTGATSTYNQVYVRNLNKSTTELVSRNSLGTVGDGHSLSPIISSDGSKIVYDSRAANLVSGVGVGKVYLSTTSY